MSARPGLLSLVVLTALSLCLPAADAIAGADGFLAYSFKDVQVTAASGGSEPFEVNKHYSAANQPALIITGTLEVRWNNSIFASYAKVMGAEGKKDTVVIHAGEDDTTPNPVGFISQVWSDLYPEVNDESSLGIAMASYQIPGNSGVSSCKFKVVLVHGKLAYNDDDSDFELVLHIPQCDSKLGDLTIRQEEAKHFLKSVDIKKLDQQVSEPQTSEQDAPSYEGVNQ